MTEALLFLEKKGVKMSDMIGDGWLRFNRLSEMSIEESVRRDVSLMHVRDEYISKYGFAVITPQAIKALRPFGPFVEVGAGSGYWAYELGHAGVDVKASDPAYGDWKWKSFTKVERISGVHAVKKYPDRNLLIVWPTYRGRWAAETLTAFSGSIVAYVGEGHGGCTATDEFHEMLDLEFQELLDVSIPQFVGVRDRLKVYRRKETR